MSDLLVPKFIAHRGVPYLSAENTIKSLQDAHANGAAWVECDVQLTADSKPVIIHDSSVDRTTNGSGLVAKLSSAKIFTLDAGGGQQVPSLEQWLLVASRLGLTVNLELKPTRSNAAQLAEIAHNHVKKYLSSEFPEPLISSGMVKSLFAYRALNKTAPLAWVVHRLPPLWGRQAKKLNLSAIVINHRMLNQKKVAKIHTMGCKVLAYTVNDSSIADRLFSIGVDSVFTDNHLLLAK